MLRELWREMLAVPEVRGDDDFFELGGDSLIAVRIFAALSDRHGVNLPLAALLQHATCNELAALIQRQQRSEEHTSELQSLMRNSYAVFCLKKKKSIKYTQNVQQCIIR